MSQAPNGSFSFGGRRLRNGGGALRRETVWFIAVVIVRSSEYSALAANNDLQHAKANTSPTVHSAMP